MLFANSNVFISGTISVNPIALRMAKTPKSFGHSECNTIKHEKISDEYIKTCSFHNFAFYILKFSMELYGNLSDCGNHID